MMLRVFRLKAGRMTDLVSYFIPSYNHEEFIEDCIRSIIKQNYPRIELLIIDDGSADCSVEIVNRLATECETRFERFLFLTQENRGLVKNLNFALKWANGEYFAPIASDDAIFSEKTTILLDYFDSENVAGVTGGYIEIDRYGNKLRTIVPSNGVWGFDDVLVRRARLFAPTAIFRTSALRTVGGYWEDIQIEDRAMWLKLTHAGYTVSTTQHIVAYYRQHSENLSKSTVKMIEARLAIYDKFQQNALLSRVRSIDLYGAARELAEVDPKMSISYLKMGIKQSISSIFSKSFFRAIKKILLRK